LWENSITVPPLHPRLKDEIYNHVVRISGLIWERYRIFLNKSYTLVITPQYITLRIYIGDTMMKGLARWRISLDPNCFDCRSHINDGI